MVDDVSTADEIGALEGSTGEEVGSETGAVELSVGGSVVVGSTLWVKRSQVASL